MGIRDDTIKLKAWAGEVWGERIDCHNRQADATTCKGYVDSNGSIQAHTRGLNEGIVFALVLKRKANREHQRKSVH
jgi:hypothetical protein